MSKLLEYQELDKKLKALKKTAQNQDADKAVQVALRRNRQYGLHRVLRAD